MIRGQHALYSKVSALYVKGCIGGYILAEGSFPGSRQELEEKGYLKKVEDRPGYYDVLMIQVVQKNGVYLLERKYENWHTVWNFDKLSLAYGVTTDELRLDGDILRDVNTNEQKLLIQGPHMSSLRDGYESFSLSLYKMMLQEKK
jgi:hypothetical protein